MNVFVRRLGCIVSVAIAALLAMAVATPGAGAFPATYGAISADGSIAVFSTKDSLMPGDTDSQPDVYERSYEGGLETYVTREVSIGPAGGTDALPSRFDGISTDGARVFFSTKEQLVPADVDSSEDVYMRNLITNTTTLVSQGAAGCAGAGCGNGAMDASFPPGGMTLDGDRVFFVTTEKLSPADNDTSYDIYMRDLSNDTTTLVSQPAAGCVGACGDGAPVPVFEAVSSDGSTVAFSTTESLSGSDSDGLQDVYVRHLETEMTDLVSTPRICPGSVNCQAVFAGISSNGSHVFFESSEQISLSDTDESKDVYDWSGGVATLVSIGPNGGNGEPNANYAGSSPDGATIYFETSERLDSTADTDDETDVYKHSGGVTSLVSTGPIGGNGPYPVSFRWISPDGSGAAVVFSTAEALTNADLDTSQDVYERVGGTTTLVSIGPEGGNGLADAAFAGASLDGSHIFFVTPESLVEEDVDSYSDLYERSGGVTTLVSAGTGTGGSGNFTASFRGVSEGGATAFFTTKERLAENDDFAGEEDVYARADGVTRLVSVGNDPGLPLAPPPPLLERTSPKTRGESIEPLIIGQTEPGAAVKIYKTPACSEEEPVSTGTGAELANPGIGVSVAPGSTTTFYATAELEGFVSACSNGVTYTQETPPPPGSEESGGGAGGGTGTGTGGGTGAGTGTATGSGSGGPSAKGGGGITYVAPETVITFGPAFKTKKRRVLFRFADGTGQPGTSFFCRIDRKAWHGCGSPQKLRRLRQGTHVFKVKAVNAAGVWEEHPVKRRFKVVGG